MLVWCGGILGLAEVELAGEYANRKSIYCTEMMLADPSFVPSCVIAYSTNSLLYDNNN